MTKDYSLEGKTFTPGRYVATGSGFLDDIKVEVTFTDTAIESIQYEEQDSKNVGSMAVTALAKQVVDEQTTKLDSIAGATISSDGFLAAVNETIRQAVGDPEPSTYIPGTYEASDFGYKGTVTVQVTTDEEHVRDVKVKSIETPELGGAALDQLVQEAEAGQTEFDIISGSTYTTQAFQSAFDQALRYARGEENPKADTPNWKKEARIDFGTGQLTLDELFAILDHLEIEITFVDKDDHFVYYNHRRHEELAGTPRSPVTLGQHVELCHPPQIRKYVAQLMSDFKTGRRRSESMFYTKPNGDKIFLHYRPIFDGKGDYLGLLETVQNGKPFIDTAGQEWGRTMHDQRTPNPFLVETVEDVEEWLEEAYQRGVYSERQEVIEQPYFEAAVGQGAKDYDARAGASTGEIASGGSGSTDVTTSASQHENIMPKPEEVPEEYDSQSSASKNN